MYDIIITDATIEGWKKEKQQLEEQIRKSQAQLELIEKRLQAVPLFVENIEASTIPDARTESSVKDLSPAGAILHILRETRGSFSAGEIRTALINEGYPKEKWGKTGSYFYSNLKRLADNQKITKSGNRYSARSNEHVQTNTSHVGNDMRLQ